jgi:hypothetical protein
MKTAKRSLEGSRGSSGLSACVKVGRGLAAPGSLTTASRHAFALAPFREQSGPASVRASREFLQTIETRLGAISSAREDGCRVEAVKRHYPNDIGFAVSRDDNAANATGPPPTRIAFMFHLRRIFGKECRA